jgi:exopolyphosphatase/pppGpp-phosphohydrolase
MENEIRLQYGATRLGVTEGAPITVLHIGEEQTAVATGTATEPDAVFLLPIGSKRTAADFFKHTPPTPGELENAIMAVEDEVTRLRAITAADSTLFTADAAIREIAIISGVPDQSESILTIEAMEQTFEKLAAVTLGRPAFSGGIPANAAFAATLLILRELMHHLQFASIIIAAFPPRDREEG